MSQIQNTALHNFANGEVVTDTTLDQNFNVLQAASNDNDNRITVLENAQAGAMTGVRSGTSFPTLPVPKTGDAFFRSDLNKLYVYDKNSVWSDDPSLTKAYVNGLGLGVTTNTNVISTGDLNTYKTSGMYYVSGTITNQPISGTGGYLIIQAGNDGTKASQTYINDNTGYIYTRVFTASAWTAWEPVNTRSYAFVNNSTSQNYSTLNTWQQIVLGAGDLTSSSDITLASNTLTLASDGIYDMSLEVEISGLNSGVFGNILIRVIPPAGHGSAYDYSINRQGGTGYGGNSGGIWMATSKIDKLWAGTQVYFMTNIGEAPRTIMHCRAKIQKISKF
jgi:hypothetical protein